MVDPVWVVIMAGLGVITYAGIPMLVMSAPIELREAVGRKYHSLAARALKQFVFLRRILSGYDVEPISVDDEQKLLKVTLSSSRLGEDNTYPFTDPDNRIARLYNKPVALAYEAVPAAVDAELAEIGEWTDEKVQQDGGLWHGDLDDPESVRYDPWVPMSSGLRLVDPMEVFNIVGNDVDPEMVKTAEKKTQKRFEKYGGGVSPVQLMSGVLGFFAGLGGIILLRYVEQKLLGGGGGAPDPTTLPIQLASDMVVMLA